MKSCYFEVPELLLYIYLPALLVSFLLGFFVYLADKENPVNRNIFFFIMFLSFWILSDLFTWLTFNIKLNLLVTRIIPIVAISLLFFLNFTFYFTGKKITRNVKMVSWISILPIILFLFTNINSAIFDAGTCTFQYGPLLIYIYLFSLFYFAWAIRNLMTGFNNEKYDSVIKKQRRVIISAMVFIVSWYLFFVTLANSSFIKESSYGDQMYIFVPIGIVIFIGMLTYAITKYQFLNIKLISAKVSTYAIWIIIGSQYFFVESSMNVLLISITLLLSIFFGRMLVKSVEEETKQKEKLGRITRKLTKANKELKRLDIAKTEFISIASHQLKTPLTITKGFISLLMEGSYGEIRKEVKEVLKKVYTSNENLILLVEDLLNISRIESGRMQYDFADWKLEEIVKGIHDILDEKARVNNLYLKINYPKEKLPKIKMDGGKVREVITNFMENALKYTKEGGVTVDFKKTDGNVQIIVTDTGIGIPKTELPFLFQKFSRGKDTKRLNATGTGLGLFVGKKVIKAHGGTVWAESQGAGKGSKFVIELPIKQEGKKGKGEK